MGMVIGRWPPTQEINMTNAKVWISYNPNTGNKRPWEVYFKADNFPSRFVSSCTTEENAKKSLQRLVKRSSELYNVTQ
jgi:hypothetical protein